MLTSLHTILGFSALALGLIVLLMKKGTIKHRMLGVMYLVSIIVLNTSSFTITNNTGSFGLFHGLAVLNLVTTIIAFTAIRFGSIRLHYYFMVWSYVGVWSAAINQTFSSVPQASALLESIPLLNIGIIIPMFLITFILLPLHEEKVMGKYDGP